LGKQKQDWNTFLFHEKHVLAKRLDFNGVVPWVERRVKKGAQPWYNNAVSCL